MADIHYKLKTDFALNKINTENVTELDWHKDFTLIKEFYSEGFSITVINSDNDFPSAGAVGYIKNGKIVSFADIMKIREGELEIGAVATRPGERKNGYSTATVALAAQKIIDLGFIPSLTTAETNFAMRAVAEKLGFLAE